MYQIYCIMWHGGNLSDDLRTLLFKAAQEMFKEEKNCKIVKTDWCEGKVMTEWVNKGIAGISGFIFKASVDWEDKSTKVEYICRQIDMDPDDEVMWVRQGVTPLGTYSLN